MSGTYVNSFVGEVLTSPVPRNTSELVGKLCDSIQMKSVNYLNLFLLLYVSTEYLETIRSFVTMGFVPDVHFFPLNSTNWMED